MKLHQNIAFFTDKAFALLAEFGIKHLARVNTTSGTANATATDNKPTTEGFKCLSNYI